MRKLVIGADIGGSHITCIPVDPALPKVLPEFTSRRPVDPHASAAEILNNWEEAFREVMFRCKPEIVSGIGFAMPGPFDYPEGIAWFRGVKKYDNLYGVDVRGEILRRLDLPAGFPVRFLNDATCFAIGESWTGKAASFRKSMAITLGTGFGSAFIEDGYPVESGDNVPQYGCVYHLPYAGSIANNHFSTCWFLEEYQSITGRSAEGVREIAIQAGESPEIAQLFTDFGIRLGNFLAPWLLRFGAECLTVGGNIANSLHLFADPFRETLSAHGWPLPVFHSESGEIAAVSGAARLCDDQYYSLLPFISNK